MLSTSHGNLCLPVDRCTVLAPATTTSIIIVVVVSGTIRSTRIRASQVLPPQSAHLPGKREIQVYQNLTDQGRMDLQENEGADQIAATFELPGFKISDIHIRFQDDRLTILAERALSHEDTGYTLRERRLGNFCRTLDLPRGVKDEDIKASLENGILTIVYPRAGATADPRRIIIDGGIQELIRSPVRQRGTDQA